MKFNYYFEHENGKVIIDQTDWDHILEMLMAKGVEIRQVAAQQSVHPTGGTCPVCGRPTPEGKPVHIMCDPAASG